MRTQISVETGIKMRLRSFYLTDIRQNLRKTKGLRFFYRSMYKGSSRNFSHCNYIRIRNVILYLEQFLPSFFLKKIIIPQAGHPASPGLFK